MKRLVTILFLGLALGGLAGTGVYLARTTPERAMLCCPKPEQAWLQHEFQLTDAQFARVQKLETQYQAECQERCRRVNSTNDLVRRQFTSHAASTPELERLLACAAQLRADCQLRMLEYCYAVSREMPPDQGQRYLNWVCDQVLTMPRDGTMMHAK